MLFLFSTCCCTVQHNSSPNFSKLTPSLVSVNSNYSIMTTNVLTSSTSTYKNGKRGTGFVIKQTKNNTFVLTVAHMCDITIDNVISTLGRYIMPTEKAEYESKMKLRYNNGETRNAVIVATSPGYDLCLLMSKRVEEPPVVLSQDFPKKGDRVYTTGFSSSIGHRNHSIIPITSGFYSGKDESGDIVLTAPVRPGASGSPIFNQYGELIGVIHAIFVQFPHISFGVSLERVIDFIKVIEQLSPKEISKMMEIINLLDLEEIMSLPH